MKGNVGGVQRGHWHGEEPTDADHDITTFLIGPASVYQTGTERSGNERRSVTDTKTARVVGREVRMPSTPARKRRRRFLMTVLV